MVATPYLSTRWTIRLRGKVFFPEGDARTSYDREDRLFSVIRGYDDADFGLNLRASPTYSPLEAMAGMR